MRWYMLLSAVLSPSSPFPSPSPSPMPRPPTQPDATYPFLTVFPELNQEMLAANARISTPHHWQTRWYQWLYNARGVSYWTLDVGNDRTSAVYLLGNPIVVWGCGAAVIAAVATIAYALKVRLWEVGASAHAPPPALL